MNRLFPEALGAFPAQFHPLLSRHWEALMTARESQRERLQALLSSPGLMEQLLRTWIASEYAAASCVSDPATLADLLESGDLARNYDDWHGHLAGQAREFAATEFASVKAFDAALKTFLRRFRRREMLRIIWRDANGAAVMDTCADMTGMADGVLDFTLAQWHPWCARELGEPQDGAGNPQRMAVIAMGKYGARELNVSSDIDLIFAFPEGGETVPPADSPLPRPAPCTVGKFFTRLGQRLIDSLGAMTGDGFAFRVDMRLRPYGSAGALALSFDAMEDYYQAQGRDWERFAMIKARAAGGDLAAGTRLLETLRPFIYRRYLDFAAIDALRDMKHKILRQVARKGMEDDIKLGRGGIREVEFIAQVFQLIHGGRHPDLRNPGLLPVLDALAQGGYLGREGAAELKRCYLYLRKLEHRLQFLHDKQTQKLPAGNLDQARVAFAMGCRNWEHLTGELAAVRQVVETHFRAVIAEPEAERTPDEKDRSGDLLTVWRRELDEAKALGILSGLGYREPEKVLAAMKAYREGRQFPVLEKTSVERLDRFMAVLPAAAAGACDPDLAFQRVFTFIQQVTRRTAYLVLLLENRLALRQLVELCEASPWVVDCLSKYPLLLDELLKPLAAPPARRELEDDLRQRLLRVPEEDFDHQMETLRYFKQAHVLLVAAAELAETMPLMKESDYLTWIAEAVLDQVVELAWRTLVARHGYPVNAGGESGGLDFAVIGYGKLGGIELNYGSDLDLVFIHDGHPERETEAGPGSRALNSAAFYVRLGQRIIHMLQTATLSGRLYEVDMRLRPSGASGRLVTSIKAFERYQHQDAWTWEHQALVRARPLAGSRALRERMSAVRGAVLMKQRDPDRLRQEVLHMRERMRAELGSRKGAGHFDLKQDAGALVDIEFIVQYLVLAWAARHPELVEFTDNMRLLEVLGKTRLLEAGQARALRKIYIQYRSRLHRLALQNSGKVLSDEEYRQERHEVTAIWNNVFQP